MNTLLIQRMYWDHNYTVEEISSRLCLEPRAVAGALGIKNYSPDAHNTQENSRDISRYTQKI